MTLPPGFLRHLQAKGLHPLYCYYCANSASEVGTSGTMCWKFGAYVLLNSTCDGFAQRVGTDPPTVGELEIKEKFRFGLNDLTK